MTDWLAFSRACVRDLERTLVDLPTRAEREPVLRAYLKRWTWEVGKFFGGVKADSPAEDLRRIAPDHPVFRIGAPR